MRTIKNNKLILGIVLILVGILWILSNLNLVDINMYNFVSLIARGIFDLWPFVLIIFGIGIMFKNDLLNTILWGLFLAILIIYSLFIKDNILKEDVNQVFEGEVYTIDMRKDIEKGDLRLDIGAANFSVDSIDDEFIRIEQDGAFKYSFNKEGSIEKLYITNKNNYFENLGTRNLGVDLNKNIPWQLNMNIGAVSGNVNLKDIMVEYINVDMGAGDLEMTLGKENNFTSLDIDAGASRITINIPEDVGIKIDFEGGLNSTNLDSLGLVVLDKGEFISKNYDDAITKYEMEVDMGVGSFEIKYY